MAFGQHRPALEGAAGQCPSCSCSSSSGSACPRCGYDLPDGWAEVETTCLVMAGARTSGKSVYIAVLKKQAEALATMLGGSFEYGSALTELTFEQSYEGYVFEERRFMPPTAPVDRGGYQREPLIFSLGRINNRQRFLVLRDVAGEDLEDKSGSVPFEFTTFNDADAVIFLFDPMTIRSISAQLTGIVKAPGGQRLETLGVLANLARLMRGSQSLSSAPITTPLALVLGKFDTLHELKRVEGSKWLPVVTNVGAAISRDPSLDGAEYDVDDAQLLQAEVEGMLTELGARPLLNFAHSNFATLQLFAVSSLGAPPSLANDINPRGLAPFRVLDPLRWVLYNQGVLVGA